MENPIDFIEPPSWRYPDHVAGVIHQLEALGFRDTVECFDLPDPAVRALGFRRP